MDENRNHKIVVPAGVILRTVGEESVLLNLETRQYYSLNPVGSRMLQLLALNPSRVEVIDQLIQEFEVSREVLEADVEELISNLHQQGLIEIQ